MKKIIFVYIAILVSVFAAFSVVGSNSEYAVEQTTWNIQKQYIDILKDPKVVPDQAFNEIVYEYEKIIKRYPDSKLIPGIHMLIGQIYFTKKDYQTAQNKFNEIVGLYPDNQELQAEAFGAIGKAYEAQDNWPQAQKIYHQIIKDYPLTQTGLRVPIYIAYKYKNQDDSQKTLTAYTQAIAHYSALADENPDSTTEYAALRYLGNCYLDQKRWMEGVETFDEILTKYAKQKYMSAKTAGILIKTINTVSIYQLNNYELPSRIYSGIIEKNPNHPFKEYFQQMVDALAALKTNDVKISPK